MCFSAGASFGASIVLAGITIVTLKKTKQKSDRLFAGIPLLFCVQQAMEGFLWLALSNTSYTTWQQPSMYIYLSFAQVVWPVFIPLSIFLMEEKGTRKKINYFFVVTGLFVSMYLGYCLLAYPVVAKIIGQHISYEQTYPVVFSKITGFLYVLATIPPAFFSQIKHMKIFGTVLFISYLITKVFYTDYVISVWCFFATAISLLVMVIIFNRNKSNHVIPST